ncbi:MAG TPA: PHB depolymerase family esterase [Methylocella sp.]|nr:PHB depolymerase family esterase [Methylocella sp.]
MEMQAAFGANPGNLAMYSCVPEGLAQSSALVVALHGCQQTARDYDMVTGWSELGRQHGFAVLFPEQRCDNNPQNCFNWFIERHISGDKGEIASIRDMIEKMVREHALDRRRIFVTGLSAGGAMACALLAACPDLFAAGSIIAGLPYGAALGPIDAIKTMAFGPALSSRELGDLVRRASPGQKKWPRVSIWHGNQDDVVSPANASALVQQWLDIHEIDATDAVLDEIDGQPRRSWRDASGMIVVEHYAISGMAHGLPVDGRLGGWLDRLLPFIHDAGISSTLRIAKSWGLLRSHRPIESQLVNAQKEGGSHIWDQWLDFWPKTGRASK